MTALRFLGLILFLASNLYLLVALFMLWRFHLRTLSPTETPGVTLMLPCYGTPPRFAECLRTTANVAPQSSTYGRDSRPL